MILGVTRNIFVPVFQQPEIAWSAAGAVIAAISGLENTGERNTHYSMLVKLSGYPSVPTDGIKPLRNSYFSKKSLPPTNWAWRMIV